MDTMIIFDMDGTLWNTIDATYIGTKLITNKYNLDTVTMKTIRNNMGASMEQTINDYLSSNTITNKEEIMDEIEKSIRKEIEKGKGITIYPYVYDTLKKLSQKYKLAIVTNNNDAYAKVLVEMLNAEELFTDYLGCTGRFNSKDEAFLYLIKKHNVKNAIYVGDTSIDSMASKKAGIPFIYARYGFGKNVENEYFIDSLRELPNKIKDIIFR